LFHGWVQDDAPLPEQFDASAAGAAAEDDEDDMAIRSRAGRIQVHKKQGKGNSKQVTKEERVAAAKQAAELELLLMDDAALRTAAGGGVGTAAAAAAAGGGEGDEDVGRAAGRGKASKKERQRLLAERKRARRAAAAGSDDEQEPAMAAAAAAGRPGFRVDLEDPRFTLLYQDQAFALDPTDPRYSKTEGIEQLATAISSKRRKLERQQQQQQQAAAQMPDQQQQQQVLQSNQPQQVERRNGVMAATAMQSSAQQSDLKFTGCQVQKEAAPARARSCWYRAQGYVAEAAKAASTDSHLDAVKMGGKSHCACCTVPAVLYMATPPFPSWSSSCACHTAFICQGMSVHVRSTRDAPQLPAAAAKFT